MVHACFVREKTWSEQAAQKNDYPKLSLRH
jgi:hypothetical protein